MGWALPGFYLLGREWLINLGLIRPQDAVEDLIYVMDFWKRFQLSCAIKNASGTATASATSSSRKALSLRSAARIPRQE